MGQVAWAGDITTRFGTMGTFFSLCSLPVKNSHFSWLIVRDVPVCVCLLGGMRSSKWHLLLLTAVEAKERDEDERRWGGWDGKKQARLISFLTSLWNWRGNFTLITCTGVRARRVARAKKRRRMSGNIYSFFTVTSSTSQSGTKTHGHIQPF